jgi:tetraacyldisaccharide 4'-kinase
VKTPAFWRGRGVLARALAPLGVVTRVVTARRMARPGFTAGIPVFCVGNATVGGSGKTILARDLLARLARLHGRPFALTRGYGGKLSGPLLVDLARHTAKEVGDEALLLAASAPTILARDRAEGARLAASRGATAIIMDDGLQNPGLKKTLSFLVVDGGYGFGNLLLLPAGPLREPVAAAAARCQAAVLIGPDIFGALAALPAGLPVHHAELVPACATDLQGRKVVAFAGIGRPEKFFTSVEQLGAGIAEKIPFPDHHVYTAADAERLAAEASQLDATLVTTEKDFVKLPASLRSITLVVTVGLRWEDEAALNHILTTDN